MYADTFTLASPRWHIGPKEQRPSSAWAIEAATARALTEGGDSRLLLDASGVNRYGCSPRPDPLLVGFASSTASVISAAGFGAAVELHARLRANPQSSVQEVQRLRAEVARRSGCPNLPASCIILAASGTDLHQVATDVVHSAHSLPLTVVMSDSAETGSGVAASIDQRGHALRTVALREAQGQVRGGEQIDADYVEAVRQSLAQAGHCLLVVTDVSKTGLLAPSLACAQELQQTYGERISVMVDACQYRLAPATVAAYVDQGFLVALTGSKFMTGPAFCGALLLPAAYANARRPLDTLPKSHWGLLLRWEAALTEIRRFRQIPEGYVKRFLHAWGGVVICRLSQDEHFEPLDVPRLNRAPLLDGSAWDLEQTIFPFGLFKKLAHGQRRRLSAAETRWVHQQMADIDESYTWVSATQNAFNTRYHLGQPVYGEDAGSTLPSALRLCMSARWVANSATAGHDPDVAKTHAMLALDKLAWLCDRV